MGTLSRGLGWALCAMAPVAAAMAAAADGDAAAHRPERFQLVPDDALAGDTLRLDPLLPGGGGASSGGPFVLTASVGQVVAQDAGSAQVLMRGGFWTPADAAGVDTVLRNGFE